AGRAARPAWRRCAGGRPGRLRGAARRAAGGLQRDAVPCGPLRGGAGTQTRGVAPMIDMLAASLGVNANDPTFWIPLVFMLLLFLLIAGGAVLDGFALGVGMPVPRSEQGR